jgi:energy-coupling factor transporter ATP-binding protein EcfA2
MAIQHFNDVQKFKYLRALTIEEFESRVVRRLLLTRRYSTLDDSHLLQNTSFYLSYGIGGSRDVVAACVADGPITLAPNATKRLAEAIYVLKQAAETQVLVGRMRVRPNILLLAVPDVVNSAAREYMEAELHGKHVQVFDRLVLKSLLDTDAPDVWQDISTNVTPYLRSLSRLVDEQKVLSDDTLNLLGVKGNLIGAADGSFVDIKLVRPATKISKVHGKFTEHFEFEEITSGKLSGQKASKILVLGEAGSGKSTLLIRLAYLMAKDGVASRLNYKIPLYVRATELAENADADILDICASAVRRLTSTPFQPFLVDDLEAGRVHLLIDGLDEVSSDLARNQVMSRVNAITDKYPLVSVVITTRPYVSIDRIDGIERYTRYRISPISFLDAQKIIGHIHGPIDGNMVETLRKLDAVHGIELNPLFVTVFGLLAATEKKNLPANITQLFSKFTELMLGRWDTNKGIEQQYQSKLKENLVSRFAFTLHKARRMRFTRSEFEQHVAVRLEELNLSADFHEVVEEAINRSGLFRGDHSGLEFRHHLIQEYFAGLGIENIDFVRSVIGDDWWRTPIVFYFGLAPEAFEPLLDIATSVVDPSLETGITVGLALQTLYLSPIRDRIEVWKWVVECAARASARMAECDPGNYPLIEFVRDYLSARDAVALMGIEKAEYGAFDWAANAKQDGSGRADLRLFWALAGLVELGEISVVKKILEAHSLEDERLNAALYIGCQMVATVRAVNANAKEAANEVCRRLEDRTKFIRGAMMDEFKGRLLELQKGEIVALDEQYESPR